MLPARGVCILVCMGKVSSWLRSKGLRKPAWHKEGFFPPSYEEEDKAAFIEINQHTLTDRERIIGLTRAVRYIEQAGIPGDIVECGVWKGGSMMAVARTLLNLGSTERRLYLFDTFEGMTAPTDLDTSQEYGSAKEIWNRRKSEGSSWIRSPLDEVKLNMASVGYPEEHTVYIQGRVEDTLPAAAPESIAILRLDTDWYESTRHEMIHLFPRLQEGGVLILDDYFTWQGSRIAVDEYLEEHGIRIFLAPLSRGASISVKQGARALPPG